jgi:hypothetical protein
MMLFDACGKRIGVERDGARWRAVAAPVDGKRAELDVVIPEFVSEDELAQFLDDLLHEAAPRAHPAVRRLR